MPSNSLAASDILDYHAGDLSTVTRQNAVRNSNTGSASSRVQRRLESLPEVRKQRYSTSRTVAAHDIGSSYSRRKASEANSRESIVPSLRRRSSHADLRAVAYYSDRPLPPLPLRPRRADRLEKHPREGLRLDKPLPRLPNRFASIKARLLRRGDSAKFRKGAERRDARMVEVQPVKARGCAAVVVPATPPSRRRAALGRFWKRKDGVQETMTAPEDRWTELYADELFEQD